VDGRIRRCARTGRRHFGEGDASIGDLVRVAASTAASLLRFAVRRSNRRQGAAARAAAQASSDGGCLRSAPAGGAGGPAQRGEVHAVQPDRGQPPRHALQHVPGVDPRPPITRKPQPGGASVFQVVDTAVSRLKTRRARSSRQFASNAEGPCMNRPPVVLVVDAVEAPAPTGELLPALCGGRNLMSWPRTKWCDTHRGSRSAGPGAHASRHRFTTISIPGQRRLHAAGCELTSVCRPLARELRQALQCDTVHRKRRPSHPRRCWARERAGRAPTLRVNAA